VQVVCPGGNNAELFRNRKERYSINVQGVRGPAGVPYIVACWPVSTHDSRIFENSSTRGPSLPLPLIFDDTICTSH
jgi:hypothetical protein